MLKQLFKNIYDIIPSRVISLVSFYNLSFWIKLYLNLLCFLFNDTDIEMDLVEHDMLFCYHGLGHQRNMNSYNNTL